MIGVTLFVYFGQQSPFEILKQVSTITIIKTCIEEVFLHIFSGYSCMSQPDPTVDQQNPESLYLFHHIHVLANIIASAPSWNGSILHVLVLIFRYCDFGTQ